MRGEREIREVASRQAGHITAGQAREIGLSAVEFRRLERSGRWVAVTPRVLRLAGAGPVRGEGLYAAVLDQGGDAAVAAETAAWWWGLPGFSPRDPSLVTTSSTTRRTTLAAVRQVRALPKRWTTELRGLRVVRPELMVLQLCAALHPQRAARALDNAWRDRLLSGASIDALLADLGRSGRNGIAVLRELRAERTGAYVPPASNLERRATDVLAPLGLDLVRQVDSGGEQWSGRVDLRDRTRPLVIEVQSEQFHTALLDRVADQARRDRFEADGYCFVEITDVELWTTPDVVTDRVRSLLRELRHAS